MSNKVTLDKNSVRKNYAFLALMLGGMVLGCIVGWFAPDFGHTIKPLGTVFINMMFCVVVPLVFASIAGSIANMRSRGRAGKIMGTTVATFIVTGRDRRRHHVCADEDISPGPGALAEHDL